MPRSPAPLQAVPRARFAAAHPLALLLLALACFVTACRAKRPISALDQAWQFACAITNDDDDRAKSQHLVAVAMLENNEVAKALDAGRRIANWRQAMVLAEAAAKLAEDGDREQAQALIDEAERFNQHVRDWHADVVRVQIAKAKAVAGAREDVEAIRTRYADVGEYRGPTTAYHALALARAGDHETALAVLDGLSAGGGIDPALWRADAYMLLAQSGSFDAGQTTQLLEMAWAASTNIPGWKQWEHQVSIAGAIGAAGRLDTAAERLEPIAQAIAASTLPGYIKAPLLAAAAEAWARMGNMKRARAVVADADQALRGEEVQDIERPSAHALLAEALAAGNDREQALAYIQRAMQGAAELQNPRPRALACVDICLSAHRAALDGEPAVADGLNSLLATFDAAPR